MRYAYLIKVDANANNNKFYEMRQRGNQIYCEYGRVGETPANKVYPINKWNQVYNKRVRGGYIDQTELMKKDIETNLTLTDCSVTNEMFDYLLNISNSLFSESYSGNKGGITERQLEEAQIVLNTMVPCLESDDLDGFNKQLTSLWSIIPRSLGRNVASYLAVDIAHAKRMHEIETDRLDNAVVQTKLIQSGSLLKNIGVEIELSELTPNILPLFQGHEKRLKSIWRLNKPSTDEKFNNYLQNREDKTTKLLWHGTNEVNVLSIMNQSLLIRPNVANGSMLSTSEGGTYMAPVIEKSLNYIRGRRRFLFLFEAHIGKPLMADIPSKVRQYSLKELEKDGYDCIYAPKGVDTGWGLLGNSEYCFFRAEQYTVRYLVEMH